MSQGMEADDDLGSLALLLLDERLDAAGPENHPLDGRTRILLSFAPLEKTEDMNFIKNNNWWWRRAHEAR